MRDAPVAQLAELPAHNGLVGGSSPSGCTNHKLLISFYKNRKNDQVSYYINHGEFTSDHKKLIIKNIYTRKYENIKIDGIYDVNQKNLDEHLGRILKGNRFGFNFYYYVVDILVPEEYLFNIEHQQHFKFGFINKNLVFMSMTSIATPYDRNFSDDTYIYSPNEKYYYFFFRSKVFTGKIHLFNRKKEKTEMFYLMSKTIKFENGYLTLKTEIEKIN